MTRFAGWKQRDLNAQFFKGKKAEVREALKRKYRNTPVEVDGVRYDSKLEAECGMMLELKLFGGLIAGYDRQVTYSLDVRGQHVCDYRADFVVRHTDGTVEVVECKGYQTKDSRLKMRLFEVLVVAGTKGMRLTIMRRGKKK